MKDLRNNALKIDGNPKIIVNGKEYHSKYNECKNGFIAMSTSHTNTGIILVPDNFDLKEEWKEQHFLAANYNAKTEEEKEEIEPILVDTDSDVVKSINDKGIPLEGLTKIAIIQASVGLASVKELLPSIIATVIIIGVIYGLYFLATYLGSKNIIKED